MVISMCLYAWASFLHSLVVNYANKYMQYRVQFVSYLSVKLYSDLEAEIFMKFSEISFKHFHHLIVLNIMYAFRDGITCRYNGALIALSAPT